MWPFSKRQERALPPGALLTLPGGSGVPTWALGPDGRPVDTDSAMRLASVWACVRLLADVVSSLPVHVYRQGSPDPLPTTPPVFAEPAAGTPTHEWIYSVMVSLLLRGNAYGLITARSGPGLLPAQTELVHPDLVSVTTDPETQAVIYRIGGHPYTRDDVWHVRAFTLPGTLLGMSPVEYSKQAIGVGLAAEKFAGQFFGDGATPSGVLTTEQALNEDAAERVLARWKIRHQGRHGTALLTNGIRYQQVAVAPEESQFLESQRFTVTQIARVFGVPPEMIGGDAGNSLTYANTEARALDFLRYSLNPWIVRLETALSRLLPSTQYAKFNVDALLRPTTEERYRAHELALRSGFMTIDEVRELEDLPPLNPPAETAAPPGRPTMRPVDRPEVA